MKFLKRFVLIVLLLALALIGIGFLLPEETRLERELRIDAAPEAVFPYVNHLRRFNEWSPWNGASPGTRHSFSGPESGVGAQMAWEGGDSGADGGSILITESRPPRRVTMRLDLGARGRPTVYFDIEPAGDGSRVTWGLDARLGSNIIERYFGLMLYFQVGGEYEQGLQDLKALVETQQEQEPGDESQ